MKRSHRPADHESAARRRDRRGERGAALITALLLTTLLLSAGGAVILTSSMAATTAADATAEMQAYYAAEAGLETALNVLRHNVAPKTAGTPSDFRTAVCGKDKATGCTNASRTFSDWLTYTNGAVPVDNGLSFTLTVRDAAAAENAPLPDAPYSPRFLVVTSTGRGPKGARKVLEMTLDCFSFDFTARAAVAIRSNDDDDAGMPVFTLGNSNPHEWSGNDLENIAPSVPAFAVTNKADYDAGDGFGAPPANLQGTGEAAVSHDNTNINGEKLLDKLDPTTLEAWLRNPANASAFLTMMRARAVATGRLNKTTDLGTDTDPKFTFVDGDLTLNGSQDTGTGLLIVTGKYSQGGSSSFHGIILALGKGNVERNGTPDIAGALVIARFDPTYNAGNGTYTSGNTFLSPSLNVDGGGNSLVGYNSKWVRKAMDELGARVVGIVEK